jgi:hypothetical protein
MTLGSDNRRTNLPNAINSSSDMPRKRSRSFWSCVSSDSKAMLSMPVSPAEEGRPVYRETPREISQTRQSFTCNRRAWYIL